MDKMDFQANLSSFRQEFNDYAENVMSQYDVSILSEPIKYSFFSGGKRLRPVIMMATADLLGLDTATVLPYALSLECIHVHSLIHDDLPSLDNDTTRRGVPCCHVVFGEGIGLLAGDALLNCAYEIALTDCDNPKKISALRYLSRMAGVFGMIGGQSMDISVPKLSKNSRDDLYSKKTSALFKAALCIPAIINDEDSCLLTLFEELGENLGILFQVTDDRIDGMNLNEVSQLDIDKVEKDVACYSDKCVGIIDKLGGWPFMKSLIKYICGRKG